MKNALISIYSIYFYIRITCYCYHSENFQRLQQDLAEMIVYSLEKRGAGRKSFENRNTLSSKVQRTEANSSLQTESPEYFHLAVADRSTYLWLWRSVQWQVIKKWTHFIACVCLNLCDRSFSE